MKSNVLSQHKDANLQSPQSLTAQANTKQQPQVAPYYGLSSSFFKRAGVGRDGGDSPMSTQDTPQFKPAGIGSNTQSSFSAFQATDSHRTSDPLEQAYRKSSLEEQTSSSAGTYATGATAPDSMPSTSSSASKKKKSKKKKSGQDQALQAGVAEGRTLRDENPEPKDTKSSSGQMKGAHSTSIHYAGTRSQHTAPIPQTAPAHLEKEMHFEAAHATAFPSAKHDGSVEKARRHDHEPENLDTPIVNIGQLPRHERFSGPLEHLGDNAQVQGGNGDHGTATKVGPGIIGLGEAAAAARQFNSPMTHHDPSVIQKEDYAPQGAFFTQPSTYNEGASSSSSAPSKHQRNQHHTARIETIHEPYHGPSSRAESSQNTHAPMHIETIHESYKGSDPTSSDRQAPGSTSATSSSSASKKRTTWFGFEVAAKVKKEKPPGSQRPLSFGYGYKEHAEAFKAAKRASSNVDSSKGISAAGLSPAGSSSPVVSSLQPQHPGAGTRPLSHSFSPSQDRPVHIQEAMHAPGAPKGHYLTHSKSLGFKKPSSPRVMPSYVPPNLRRSHLPPPPPAAAQPTQPADDFSTISAAGLPIESSSAAPHTQNVQRQLSRAKTGPEMRSFSPSQDRPVHVEETWHTSNLPKGHYLTHSTSLRSQKPSTPRGIPSFAPPSLSRSHVPTPPSPLPVVGQSSNTSAGAMAAGAALAVPMAMATGVRDLGESQHQHYGHKVETMSSLASDQGHREHHSTATILKKPKADLSLYHEEESSYPRGEEDKHENPPPSTQHVPVIEETSSSTAASAASALPIAAAAVGVVSSSQTPRRRHSIAVMLKRPKVDLSLYPEEDSSYPRGEEDRHENPPPSAQHGPVIEAPSSSATGSCPGVAGATVPTTAAALGAAALTSSHASSSRRQRRHSTAAMLKKPKADLSLYPEEESVYPRGEEDKQENPTPSEHPVGAVEEVQLDEDKMHAHHDAHMTMTDKLKGAIGSVHMPLLSSKSSKKKKKKKEKASAAAAAGAGVGSAALASALLDDPNKAGGGQRAAGVAAALRAATPEPGDVHEAISARSIEPVLDTPSTVLVTDKATTTHPSGQAALRGPVIASATTGNNLHEKSYVGTSTHADGRHTTSNVAGPLAAATAAIAAGAATSHNRKMSRKLKKERAAAEANAPVTHPPETHVSKASETAASAIPAADFAAHSRTVDGKTGLGGDDDIEAAVIRAADNAAMEVENTSRKPAVSTHDAGTVPETEGSTSAVATPGDQVDVQSADAAGVKSDDRDNVKDLGEDEEGEDETKKAVKKEKVPLKTRISKATASSAAAVTAAAAATGAAIAASAEAYKDRQPVREKPTLRLTEDDVPKPSMPQVGHIMTLTEDDVPKPIVPTVSHVLTLNEDDVHKPTVPIVSQRLTLTEDDVDKPVPKLSAPPVIQLTEDDVVKPDPSLAPHPVVPKVEPKLVSTSAVKVANAPRPMIPAHPVQGKDIKFPKMKMPVFVMPRPKMPKMLKISKPKMPRISKPKMPKFSAPKLPHVHMPTLRKKSAKVAPEAVQAAGVPGTAADGAVEELPIAEGSAASTAVTAAAATEPVRTFVVNPPPVKDVPEVTPTITTKLVEPLHLTQGGPAATPTGTTATSTTNRVEPIQTFVVDPPPVRETTSKPTETIRTKLYEPIVTPSKSEEVVHSMPYIPPPPAIEAGAGAAGAAAEALGDPKGTSKASLNEYPLPPEGYSGPLPSVNEGDSLIWVKKIHTTQEFYDSEDEDDIDEYGYRKDRDVSRYVTPMTTPFDDGKKHDYVDYNLKNHTRPDGYQGVPVTSQQVYNYDPSQQQQQQQQQEQPQQQHHQHRLFGINLGQRSQPRQSAV
ncbi:hypothetical protein BGX28_000447 [Mortierella sp. GBA30]|nr:hypothetical protein BGX28_000447 [Mortierella sp. GBA30]